MPRAANAQNTFSNISEFDRFVTQFGLDRAMELTGMSREGIERVLTPSKGGLNDLSIAATEGFGGLTPNRAGGSGITPETNRSLGSVEEPLDRAKDLVKFGGQTADTRQTFDRFNDITQGQTAPQFDRENAARQITADQGRTPELDFLRDQSQGIQSAGGFTKGLTGLRDESLGIIRSGGRDADLKRVRDVGLGLVQSGGFTPELQNLVRQAQAQISSAGQLSPEQRQLFDEAIKLVKSGGRGGALIDEKEFIGFAREEASEAINRQGEAARRAFLQRGGSAGAAVGPGGNLGEFADQAAQAEAKAIRDASLGHQNLRLHQLLGAGGIASDVTQQQAALKASITGSANSLLGSVAGASASNLASGAGLAADAERTAAQRLGIGVSGLGNAESIAAQRLQAAQQLGLGVEGQVADRFFGGLDTLGDLTRNRLAGGQGALGLLGLEADRANIGFEAVRDLGGLKQNIFTDARDFASGQSQQTFNNEISILDRLFNAGQTGNQNILNAAQIGFGGANQFTNFAGTGAQGFGQSGNALINAQSGPRFGEQLGLRVFDAAANVAAGS